MLQSVMEDIVEESAQGENAVEGLTNTNFTLHPTLEDVDF